MLVLVLGILATFVWMILDPGFLSIGAFFVFGFLSLIFAIWPSRAAN